MFFNNVLFLILAWGLLISSQYAEANGEKDAPTRRKWFVDACAVAAVGVGGVTIFWRDGWFDMSPKDKLNKEMKSRSIGMPPYVVDVVHVGQTHYVENASQRDTQDALNSQAKIFSFMLSQRHVESFEVFDEQVFSDLVFPVFEKLDQQVSFGNKLNNREIDLLAKQLQMSDARGVVKLFVDVRREFPAELKTMQLNQGQAEILFLYGAPSVLWAIGKLPNVYAAGYISEEGLQLSRKLKNRSLISPAEKKQFDELVHVQREIETLVRIAQHAKNDKSQKRVYLIYGSSHDFARYNDAKWLSVSRLDDFR